ncbi:MAG: hypothetical protein Q8S96_06500 [Hydrogenophaga sp.]|uniref:hypothetical protein n=1 Tax=Hydrogenophaga sp. TaxID=1904254 RepID=UPI00271A20C9|nr:hypothetical protein [Hydrogenophaga sp.]MDZ4055434.1 hypothetical protein [Polynucleobacter sp.]MDO9482596.1 hypothetical protein [Hydrogenophaga sp.]MDP3344093.1 hypothetical protein [Hydrogenophaga sp.]MDP3806287.1 hypothetical protein [Hydrogenophaga sp.]MDP3925450.1 hypothetical protein [Hydrogenophaga sp.]
MDVAVVIVEQLDSDGTLRTFRMQADYGDRLIVAFADEYEESRSGPFHFLDDRHESAFQKAFAECRSLRVSSSRFSARNGIFHFVTSWAGIPTERQRLSYYAICLPEHAIPTSVRFTDPRSRREYKKVIVRDDQRQRFILYLECRSSHGTFDFALEVDFRIAADEFAIAEFKDETTSPFGAHVDAYESLLPRHDQVIVQQFFSKDISMGDQYNVTGQVGAIGPNAKAENNTFNQVLQQAASSIDLPALAAELASLRNSLRQQATEIEHDQAIACIGAAESAAKKQDGAGALGHLKSAGKWAFDVATKIGTTVAAKAIQTAMGL